MWSDSVRSVLLPKLLNELGLSEVRVMQVISDDIDKAATLRAEAPNQMPEAKHYSVVVETVANLLNGTAKSTTNDVVVLSDIFSHMELATVPVLYKAILRCLVAGGVICICDIVLPESGVPLGVNLVAPEDASYYPFSSYVGWLHAAGFEGVKKAVFEAFPGRTVVTASRCT